MNGVVAWLDRYRYGYKYRYTACVRACVRAYLERHGDEDDGEEDGVVREPAEDVGVVEQLARIEPGELGWVGCRINRVNQGRARAATPLRIERPATA